MLRKYAQLEVLDAWRVASGPKGLRKAAHRVSFDYTPRPGYLYVRARAISSRCNDNWDAFPAPEIEKGYRTFLGKPAFVNHHNANHRRARGVIVAAAIHRDRNPDGSPDTWVELLHEIDAQTFPKFAKAILSGRVNRTSMGVDCEYSTCSACGNRATSPAEYCQHMPGKKGMKIRKRNQRTGKLEESIIHEICAGLTFFENSFLVEDPADPSAYVLDKPYLHAMAVRKTAQAGAPDLLAHFAGRKEAFTAARRFFEQPLYHGTRTPLIPGEQLTVDRARRYPNNPDLQTAPYVHATTDPAEAHRWGERANASQAGRRAEELGRARRVQPGHNEGHSYPARVYRVRPTGPVEPDLEYADTERDSYRSAHPMRVAEEVRPLECYGEECGGAEHWPDHPHYPFLKAEQDEEDERDRERYGMRRQAITGGEPQEDRYATWAEPTPGKSPVGAEVWHNMSTREPGESGETWYHGISYHGPYHIIRHPQTRETWVVDREGRDASPHPTVQNYGNPEKQGYWGEQNAQEHWHGLESAGPDAGRIGTRKEPNFALTRERTPAFPHSRYDPEEIRRAARPDARVAEPRGYSPEDEWHGPYEVVKHPETGRFHVIDNAGRKAPMADYRGAPTQMGAERSRDYIDQRQQSKERGRQLAGEIFSKGMDILDPGGTEESRQSERNTEAGQDLMTRYAGGKGEIKTEPDEEGGRPYYHREITHENGRPTGWYAKHYGGLEAHVYHHATGDEAQDDVQLPSDSAPHERDHLPDDFDDIELHRHLKAWYHEPDGMRRHMEDEHWTRGGDERIQRWKRGHQAARHQAAIEWEGQEQADADNAYPLSGCHHTSCGRWLHHRTAAALDIAEERLHRAPDPAVHPVRAVAEGARAYSSAVGLDDPHREPYASIETNPGRIRRLAQAYHALPMDDPGAHAAFADMAAQVHRQYDHLTNRMGVRVESVHEDPYANHMEMAHDLEHNRRLRVLSTAATGPHGFFNDDTNDKFRAVHDAFGHAATGRGFDRHGEEAAWLAHSRMFSGPARHAMTTETRGQNSTLIATGQFAPQKTALMPRELMERDAALRYQHPEDHPFFQANPVSADNIKHAWYNHTTEGERDQASRWYPDAHLVGKAIAHGDAALGAGMLSAYSPLTRWPANMFNAARSIHEGRAMGTQKGDGAIMAVHWRPAQRILAGEHHSQVFSPQTAMKTHAFAHLIEHGGNTDEDLRNGTAHVVVDRHALSVAVGRRVTDEDYSAAPVSKHRFYHHVAGKYIDAARDISGETGKQVDPATVQAGTWLAQVRRNETEDATMRGRLGRGRTTRGRQDIERWQEYSRQHHPDLPGSEIMHLGALQAMGGDPPLRMPQSVDTLRPEACPVCGNADVFKGQRCPVCGFVSPPDIFRDPDIDQARANRQALEEGAEESPYPEGPADEEQMLAAGAEPGMNPEPIGSGEDAGEQLFHPDQIAPDGVPGVQPEGAPGQGMLEPSGEEEQPAEGELAGPGEVGEDGELPEDEQLEGEQLAEEGEEEQQEGEQEEEQGTEGEAAEEAAEEEGLSPGKEQDEDERPGGQMSKRRTAATVAATASNSAVAELRRENAVLRQQLQFVAELAGIGPELDEIRRQADVMNPAQPVPDPQEEPPTQTTEEALASGAPTGSGSGTARGPGHTEDDPSRPGITPGSLTAVPAEQTTTALTPGVEIPTAPASNLVDVTAPVQGTNPSQDGGVPMEQRRIETDVRINPDPLAAQGPGIGGAGNDGTSFPWTIGARQVLDGPASEQDERGARTMASMRLGRLQVQAGLARGDELEVGSAIEQNASLSLRDIEHEIDTITRMARATTAAQPRYPRGMAPRTAARSAPSFSGSPAPVMAMAYGPDAGSSADDSDLFLD